jgi:hypothetical protein
MVKGSLQQLLTKPGKLVVYPGLGLTIGTALVGTVNSPVILLIWVDEAREGKVSFFVFTIREFNLLGRLKQQGSSMSYQAN